MISDKLKDLREAFFNMLRYFKVEDPTDEEFIDKVQPIMNDIIANSDRVIKADDQDNNTILFVKTVNNEKVFVSLSITELQEILKPKTYKVYMTQESDDNPYITGSLINTTGVNVSNLERITMGRFRIVFESDLASDIVLIDLIEREIISSDGELRGYLRSNKDLWDTDTIYIETRDPEGNLSDALMLDTPVEILVYS